MPKRELFVSLAVASVASVLAWFRLDGRTRGVVWAEDGMFLQDRLEAGPLVSLVDPYQGYLHLVPRAVVEVAALVPLEDYAVAVTGLCCLTVGAVAGLVHACSRDVVGSRAARVVLGLVTVLVPTAAAELLGNTANLHWFLLWLTPWVLLCRPTSWRQGWALGAVLLAVTLTEIQAVYFVPLLLVGIRDRRRIPMAVAMLAGLAAQLVMALTVYRPDDEGTPSVPDLVQGYGLHVFLQMWRPATGGVGDVLVDHGWSLVVLASAPFLVVLAALVAGSRTRDRLLLTGTLLVGALAPYVVGMVLNFRSFLAFDGFALDTLAVFAPLRYAVVPAMFVLAAAVVVADRGPRVLRAAVLAGVLALGLWHLDPGPTNRSEERGWSAAVDEAAAWCRDTGVAMVQVKTAPVSWEIFLDCAVVLGGPDTR